MAVYPKFPTESESLMAPCDVLVTKSHRVFINGTEIGFVVQMDMDYISTAQVQMTLRLYPTSVLHGDPPKQTVQDLHDQGMSDTATRVDIDRAIQRAKDRVAKK